MTARHEISTDVRAAAEAVAFAQKLERDGVSHQDIASTLSSTALAIMLEIKGAAMTAAWLRALADTVEVPRRTN
jgi:hypothetical protein